VNISLLEEFSERFSKSNQSLGNLSVRDVPYILDKSALSFRVSGNIEQFYSWFEMEDAPTIGGDFFLQIFSFDELEKAQDGWAGPDDEEIHWKQSYVVFGDRSGDALVFDSAQSNPEIYGSIQKRSFLVAESLAGLLEALIVGIKIEEDEFDGDTRGEDMSLKEDFVRRVEGAISTLTSGVNPDGFMRFFFG
jgi:hypothetical protein